MGQYPILLSCLAQERCESFIVIWQKSPTISWGISTYNFPTSCVSTVFVNFLWYYVDKAPGRRHTAATVASSSESRAPSVRIFAANSPGGCAEIPPIRRRAASPSTPSLSNISTSPRRRDSRSVVSRLSPTDNPGGGPAVPIFSANSSRST